MSDRELFRDEIEQYMADYSLPDLPGYYERPGARALILFRRNDVNVTLTYCTLEDAREYCRRADTRGDDWFTGFDLAGSE